MKTNKPAKPANNLKTKKVRVLIVDNHPLVRRGTISLLKSEKDLEVCGQCSNAEALATMKESEPDVVLVDITLHGSSGLGVISEIAFDPKVKVIAIDLNDEPTYATRAIKAGAKGYVTDNPDANLAPAIRRVFAGHLSVSDSVAQQMIAAITQTATTEPMESLSNKELEVAELMGKGSSTSQIASALKISIKTVETHKAHIKRKLGIATGSQLVRYCVQWYEQRNSRR